MTDQCFCDAVPSFFLRIIGKQAPSVQRSDSRGPPSFSVPLPAIMPPPLPPQSPDTEFDPRADVLLRWSSTGVDLLCLCRGFAPLDDICLETELFSGRFGVGGRGGGLTEAQPFLATLQMVHRSKAPPHRWGWNVSAPEPHISRCCWRIFSITQTEASIWWGGGAGRAGC